MKKLDHRDITYQEESKEQYAEFRKGSKIVGDKKLKRIFGSSGSIDKINTADEIAEPKVIAVDREEIKDPSPDSSYANPKIFKEEGPEEKVPRRTEFTDDTMLKELVH